MIVNKEREERRNRCTTCAEQCVDHDGGLPYNGGCLCNDGEFLECNKNKRAKDVYNGETK
jgi:hypothetical protein